MRWVTPLMLIGTSEEADRRHEPFITEPEQAITAIKIGKPVVVSTREVAAAVIRHFGASEDWINRHVMSDWEEFTGFDATP
jgi:hypothetical protein